MDKNRKICAPPPQNLKVEDIIKHPEFNANRGTNDIALLRVSRMDFSSSNYLYLNNSVFLYYLISRKCQC